MTTTTQAPLRASHLAPDIHATVGTATGWSRRIWLLLVVLCGALFLDGLDVSMVGVALPSIGADLHMGQAQLQWIVSGYVLGYGGLLLLGGRASDLIGRRSVFLSALAVFGLASVATALVDVDLLIIALRFVKGVAAAFTVPAGLSIITTTFAEGPARNKALSIYTVCGASGFSLGLVFGGLLTELSWRATLLFPGPVALVLLAVGLKVVPRAAGQGFRLAHFDVLGALTSTGSLLVFVYAVVQAPQAGWGSGSTVGLLVAAAVLLAAFVAVERRHAHPLLRLGILRSVRLVHANLAGMAMFGGYVAFQFVVTLYLQDSLQWSPLAMALGFLPAGLIVVASATKMDKVLDRVPTPLMIAVGLAAFVIGYLLFLRVQPGMGYAAFLLPTIILLGVGFALCFPAVNSQATAGVDDDEQGLASGLVNTSIQLGGAVMLAVTTAILGSAGRPTAGALIPGMIPAVAVVSALTVTALVATIGVIVRRR
ncbi:MFS transporter [Rhodococcus sp. D2-41]|uniref:MFS transporter n=1 Tax=Speluncibacter jeojiensis TaxID=2710754 RepID=A0A9X4RCQ0_9ACTN|nr:MFS transporter [Rhodococcus sp. D2-41]MDG3010355.1 MFS transporter [Rhodococcus sp. D2-41]MDG3014090.1 MFS transporter [Corynebacteriales bacterium D3-21]